MSYSTTRNHHGYGGKFIDDNYGMGGVNSDEDYDPQEDDIADGQGQYGPYSTGYARSGPGDRKLDGGRDRRKKPQQGNNYDNDDYSEDDYDDDDYDGGYGNQDGQYGPYSTGKARSGQGDRRLDGHHDGRKKPGGNNPSGTNGYTKGGNNNNYGNQRRSQNNNSNNNRRRSNYNDNDSDDYNNNQQGNYGRYSQGKSRSGPGDRKLDGTRDRRKKPQGDDSDDDDDNNYNGNSGNYNNNYRGNQQGGQYGPYSTGKARSGQGDRRLDGQHDGRKKPGGNNPSGTNGYTKNDNNRNRNRNYQNDSDDDNDNEDYGQNTRKQRNYGNNNSYNSNNNSGRQNRSGPGDRRLDGGKDMRKKPNRSDNYQN